MSIPADYIRKIIHVDMDAFYASVEQRDRPELRGKPVAVGGSAERGVVAAASYEARKFGVRSAMASSLALRKCPALIFVKPDFAKYKDVSSRIREIFFEYTDLVEPLSLDEAYLDVTENKKGIATATRIAREIRERIYQQTGLRASAGISINKFLAKVASDINKPNGQKTILPEDALQFLEDLPIGKFYGIGSKTADTMKRLGIQRGKDLKAWPLDLLTKEFGKSGKHFYHIVRGLQKSEVRPQRAAKSYSVEKTFERDLISEEAMKEAVLSLFQRLSRKDLPLARSLHLKLKYENFEIHSRSLTLPEAPALDELLPHYLRLLQRDKPLHPVRLIGLGLSNFQEDEDCSPTQLTLKF